MNWNHSVKYSPSIFASGILSGILLIFAASCAPRQRGPATLVPFQLSESATAPCPQEEVPPRITETRPAEVRAGDEVTVIGSGGFTRDTCGSTVEGSRTFKVYLDNEPVAGFSCYINHCEGKFSLSGSIASGAHCLSTQRGTCQLELQVAAK